MTDKEMWELFCTTQNIGEENYEAWAFGSAPDKLVDLVLKGLKLEQLQLLHFMK